MAVNFTKKSNAKDTGDKPAAIPSFMKTGQAAQKALEKQAEKDEKKFNKIWRVWMPEGAETQLTFLDGGLDSSGLLTCPMWYEHQLQIAGDWKNWFVCVKEEEPCPICETDESRLVAGFTVIDHSSFQSKKSGIIQDTLKLFVAKQETLKMLQKIATKRGGLTGITFDVSRTGDNAAAVGNMFDFVEKRTLKVLQNAYGNKDKQIVPYDYGVVIEYKTAAQLHEEGFGSKPVGSETSYKNEL